MLARLEKQDMKKGGGKWLAQRLISVIQIVLLLAVVQTVARANRDEAKTAEREILFRLYLPDAPEVRRVEVIGNFNSWRRGSTLLHGPDKNGKWETTVTVKADVQRIEYIYLVNGRRFIDSRQGVVSDDFGSENNILMFPGAASSDAGREAAASASP